MKLDIERFNDYTNFSLWQVRITTILVRKGLKKVIIEKKLENLDQSKWDELDEKALFAIQFCITNASVYISYGRRYSIRAHISEFVSLNGLKNIKVQIDDEDQVMLLLYSLPHSYKSFRETLIYGRDKLSFEEVNGNLLNKGKLDNEFGSDSSSG
ncbi:uncharacterized protein LOC128043111 [Gossypium raimondii]|uniref:uncharacterized protein LOC128043111 n=1 Tax=Gossypium raimondii TaxID=29730 RepID=UPI002279F492|nr:uncharacterized protein LOC128043111 [Gossypium raimondii]